ncbi:MmgE/PrpD family protein [Pseudonocardia spinosispora]|uniref:MmgE/PrpD family protein n=1 Tax=Pseudonocardia spinosispora TaxID=103441 RepID=UPI0003FEA863|nr:MmgE/PrpD family protein [Pseudonocardia spinosispora]
MPDRFLVEELGRFSADSRWEHVSESARSLLRRNVLDSVGCAIAALDGELPTTLREHASEVGGNPVCTLIGGGRTSMDQAALISSVQVRYVDLLDTYLTPGGLCHPADNFGALLAVAEASDVGGRDFLLALALAYELQARFSAQVPVMAKGLNHALQLAMSVAAGSAKLWGLDAGLTAHAISIAAADNVSLAAVHSEPVSQWKGVSPGITAQRAVYTTGLASRGVTGPKGLFEGPNGLFRLFDQTVDFRLSDPSLDVVEQTHLKKYCALIHGQPVIEAVLKLARFYDIAAGEIARVDLEVFQTAFDIAGGGSFGDKDDPGTKEQADYNLRYLAAVALLDRQVGPEQLSEERIQRRDTQQLLGRVHVRADDALTEGYPATTPVRVHITLRDGRRRSREQIDFEGAPGRAMSWDQVVRKFHWLAEPYADEELRGQIVACVAALEVKPVTSLTRLLGKVSRQPRRARQRSPF